MIALLKINKSKNMTDIKATKKTAVKKTVKKNVEKNTKKDSLKLENSKLRIIVKAYEPKILDISIKQIIDIAKKHEAEFFGPTPLPTEIKKYTVNRSTFIYKNAREQFEMRTHKRIIDVVNPNPKLIEALSNLSLPSGVDVDIKML